MNVFKLRVNNLNRFIPLHVYLGYNINYMGVATSHELVSCYQFPYRFYAISFLIQSAHSNTNTILHVSLVSLLSTKCTNHSDSKITLFRDMFIT